MLKIDVEGFEAEVLKGAKRVLSDVLLKAVLLELNGSGEKYGAPDTYTASLLLGYGFKAVQYKPISRDLIEIENYKDNVGIVLFVETFHKYQIGPRLVFPFKYLVRLISAKDTQFWVLIL